MNDYNESSTPNLSNHAALLKPIKELAQNWNIDIASELVEYLDALESIEICLDENGETKLNFAEAALLIQGSTMVYSKKVESLYNLVYQTLDHLSNNSDSAFTTNRRGRHRRNALDDEEKYAADREKFLLLDDVVPLAKAESSITLTFPKTREEKKKIRHRALKPTLPHALMAGRSDIGLAESSQSLKLMTCGVFNGAVVLDDRLLKSDLFQKKARGTLTSSNGAEIPEYTAHGSNENGSYSEDDNDDAGGGFFGGSDSEGEEHIQDHLEDRAALSPARETRSVVPEDEVFDEDEEAEESEQIWGKLDPHNDLQLPSRPFKKGKTWVVPKRLKDEDSSAAQKEDTVQASFVSMVAASNPNPKRTLIYPEFSYYMSFQFKLQKKHNLSLRKKSSDPGVSFQGAESIQNGQSVETDEYDEYDDFVGGDYEDEDSDDNVNSDDKIQGLEVDESTLNAAPDSYVELVRQHVKKYLHSADEWAIETNLHQRVREWQEKVQPLLQDQDGRPSFDIHSYGAKILDRLEATDDVAESKSNEHEKPSQYKFEDILLSRSTDHSKSNLSLNQPVQKYEICRLFLASLQLANNGNVLLKHESNDSDDLELVLLDNELHSHFNRHLRSF